MTRLLGLIVLSFAFGCGGGSFPYEYRAGPFVVHSQIDLQQDALDHDVEVAQLALGSIIPMDSFHRTFSGMPVYVYDSAVLGKDLCGRYDAFTGIDLTREVSCLGHELLHAWDTGHLALGTAWHQGWKTNGYDAASEIYVSEWTDPSQHWDGFLR